MNKVNAWSRDQVEALADKLEADGMDPEEAWSEAEARVYGYSSRFADDEHAR
jgi:hypothetical protein